MADNYLEYRSEELQAKKAKKEQARKARLRKYLEAYKKKLKEQAGKDASAPRIND